MQKYLPCWEFRHPCPTPYEKFQNENENGEKQQLISFKNEKFNKLHI